MDQVNRVNYRRVGYNLVLAGMISFSAIQIWVTPNHQKALEKMQLDYQKELDDVRSNHTTTMDDMIRSSLKNYLVVNDDKVFQLPYDGGVTMSEVEDDDDLKGIVKYLHSCPGFGTAQRWRNGTS